METHVKQPETEYAVPSQAVISHFVRSMQVVDVSRYTIASTIALKVGLGRMAFVVFSLSG